MSSSAKQAQDRSNLITRAITALIGGPLILIITYVGGVPFFIMGLVLAVLSLLEFCVLGNDRQMPGNIPVGVVGVVALVFAYTSHEYVLVPGITAAVVVITFIWDSLVSQPEKRLERVGMTTAALLYAGLPASFMILIRALPDGLLWMVLIFMLTWGTDTLAYVGGRMWGKRLLAPSISPKKTVEGAVVGVVGGFVLGLLTLIAGEKVSPVLVLLAIIAPPLAVAGDLFESRLKRYFHVGDSHVSGLNIIPGHGGVLDRTDALIWVATLFYLYFVLSGVGL
ncbi:MAG: phosphatidate cytidylyltransferase [Anaerolineae bacterium]|nr:phosphatidate cytidylyltransferase [Anaerolineae bacterium]